MIRWTLASKRWYPKLLFTERIAASLRIAAVLQPHTEHYDTD